MNASIRLILFIIIVLVGSVYVGFGMATDYVITSILLFSALVILLCVSLGRRVWLLIPFVASLGFTVMIPGRPSLLQLGQLLFVSFYTLLVVTRKVQFSFRVTMLEFLALCFLGCVGQSYLRNPVGLNLMGAGSVGGRPYILYAMAFVTMLIFCGIRVYPKELIYAKYLVILGGALNFLMGALGWFIPSIGYWYGAAQYNNYSDPNAAVDSEQATRVPFAKKLGPNAALWVSSHVSPLKACFNIKWIPLVLIAFAAAAASGYRNAIVATGLTFLVGLLYRGGVRSILISTGIGGMLLVFLAALNMAYPLPANIQRSLSWLPGTWEERYILDAQESSEWRFEIWEEVLLTDHWIENKVLGDGLGFTAEEYAYQEELRLNPGGTGISGFDAHRETILVNGDYHSGPISAIRTIGYIGLFIMLLMFILIALRAHRQILRAKSSEWFSTTLIFCIPMIWAPIFFVFVFGSFERDSVFLMLSIGMLRLLENNLPLPPYSKNAILN